MTYIIDINLRIRTLILLQGDYMEINEEDKFDLYLKTKEELK